VLAAVALRLATTRDRDGDPVRSPAQHRGDALVEIFRRYCDHRPGATGSQHRPHLNVVIDLDALQDGEPGSFFDRTTCDAATARRIAGVHRVLRSGSAIIDLGRTTRTIPAPTYTALVLRDGGCRYPGCDRPADWCDGHHVQHWADGGPTDLTNLVLLCSGHHHLIHRRSSCPSTAQPSGPTRTGGSPRRHDCSDRAASSSSSATARC
jgi:hypothetical protein